MASTASTAKPENVALFGTLAADWWDPDGSSKLLHRINPARLGFIHGQAIAHFDRDPRARRGLLGLKALDVGCGGGLVAEPLARMGADVTGIDAGEQVIAVARAHAEEQGLEIDYRAGDVVDLAREKPGFFDLITCLEVVEHVADRRAFLRALHDLLKPGGLLIYSTPNRTPQSYAVLIVGAERIARLIPDGGHHWKQFITPAELADELAAAGLHPEPVHGLSWAPHKGFHISGDKSVNYIGIAVRREETPVAGSHGRAF
ncbi:MAG: bifunctional 2-polyprenyl-6-hydroxyphenol methylase/3-demethylubiquinol 3-O-methyltransferase UbiG [Sphingomonadaceae bacterium]